MGKNLDGYTIGIVAEVLASVDYEYEIDRLRVWEAIDNLRDRIEPTMAPTVFNPRIVASTQCTGVSVSYSHPMRCRNFTLNLNGRCYTHQPTH